MAEKCHNCRRAKSRGSIGMLRYCWRCAANLMGWKHDDPRLNQCVDIMLTNDDVPTGGWARWVPDWLAKQEAQR